MKKREDQIAIALAIYNSEKKTRGGASIGAFYDVVLAYLDSFERRLADIDHRLASVIDVGKP